MSSLVTTLECNFLLFVYLILKHLFLGCDKISFHAATSDTRHVLELKLSFEILLAFFFVFVFFFRLIGRYYAREGLQKINIRMFVKLQLPSRRYEICLVSRLPTILIGIKLGFVSYVL